MKVGYWACWVMVYANVFIILWSIHIGHAGWQLLINFASIGTLFWAIGLRKRL